jgi:CelD/BcsL family acetyltransferase involved in cellulose biosynthesis
VGRSHAYRAATEADQWLAWLERLPIDRRDVYCTPGYAAPFRRCFGDEGELFVWEAGNTLVLVPLLRRPLPADVAGRAAGFSDLSTPYGYGGPIARDPDAVDWAAFRDAFAAYCRETRVLTEFERLHPALATQAAYAGLSGLSAAGETYWIDLKRSSEAIENGFRSGHRQSIRKARAAGTRVRVSADDGDLAAFHDLYLGNMRRAEAARRYFLPLEFFAETLAALGAGAMLLVAEFEGRVVAGAILLRSDEFLHYHFAALDRDAGVSGAGALLVAEGARLGAEAGCSRFHLGGGPVGSGLDLFKEGFGGRPLPFATFAAIHAADVYAEVCAGAERIPCYRADPISL